MSPEINKPNTNLWRTLLEGSEIPGYEGLNQRERAAVMAAITSVRTFNKNPEGKPPGIRMAIDPKRPFDLDTIVTTLNMVGIQTTNLSESPTKDAISFLVVPVGGFPTQIKSARSGAADAQASDGFEALRQAVQKHYGSGRKSSR